MRIKNRRAFHDYNIIEKIEAGLSLTGNEVQSIKNGRANIDSAFVRIRNGEAVLLGANIPPYSPTPRYDPMRARKVLLHKDQLIILGTKQAQQNLTLVPISLYTKGRLIKAELGLGKGKKQYEKREAKRRKDLDREAEIALRDKIRG